MFIKLLVQTIIIMMFFLSGQFIWAFDIKFERKAVDLESQMDGAILRDRDGFLWFGAFYGAARYDGYELKKIRLGSEGGSWVTAIAEDKDGILWFGTHDGGVSSYDKKSNTWKTYKHKPRDINSLSCNVMPTGPQALYIDNSNKIWVGTEGCGLNQFDKETNTWTRYQHNPKNKNSLSNDKVKAITEDKDGLLWIGTMEGGLNSFDRTTKTWTHYKHNLNDQKTLSDNHVQAIVEDSEDILWIGTAKGGLNQFNRDQQTFSHYKHDPDNANSIGDNNVFFIMEDSLKRLWLCKHHSNPKNAPLSIFDKTKQQFYRYYSEPKNQFTPSTHEMSGVYEDPVTGIIWTASSWLTGIIDKYDKNERKFKRWDNEAIYPDNLRGKSIPEIYEDSQGMIWIASESFGITKYDRKTNKFSQYAPDPNDPENTLPHAWIGAILEEKDGTFWITSKNTLCIFDRQTAKVIKRYQHDSNNPNSIRTTFGFRSLIQDKDSPDIFWLGTQADGIQKFDRHHEVFTVFKHDNNNPQSLSFDANRILHDDGKGSIWVPTSNGLSRLNKKTGQFKNYFHDPEDPRTIFSNFLLEVYGDSKGNLWICGKGGIAKFNYDNETFKNYSKENGYPVITSNTYSILEDKNGYFWLGTKGVIKFDPEKETFQLFTKNDNLQPNNFLPNANLQTKDGEIWLGGLEGLNSFYPDKLIDNQYIPPVVLTSLTKGGKDIDTGMAPEKLKEIKLDWRDNFFEFQFAVLNYTRPANNKYAYMLEGRDIEWYNVSHPFGMYSDLEGGTYILRLKGANNDGVWNEKGIAIRVIVSSPPWKTWWFYTLSGTAIFLIGLSLFIQRERQLKAKNETRVLAKEMDIAKHIQTSLLPQHPQHEELEIAAAMIPADEVGGDYYDISYDKAGNLWIGIGDVSGHGVSAGLIMMMVQSAFTTFHQTIQEREILPSEVVIAINRVLFQNVNKRLNASHFMTLTIFKYLSQGRFSYAGAHLDLIVHHAQSNSFKTYGTLGLFMNLLPDVAEIIEDAEFTLEKGDTLIIYTDGFPEAKNHQEEGISNQLLDFNRFLDIIKKHIHKDVEAVKEGIIKDTLTWCNNIRDDDMTLIVIRKK